MNERSFWSGAIIFVLFFSLNLGFGIAPKLAYAGLEDNIANLRERIKQLEERAQKYQQELVQNKQEQKTLHGEIADLTAQLNRLLAQLHLTSNRIELTQLEINQLQNDIAILSEDIGRNKQFAGNLMQSMYESDQDTLLSLLLRYDQLSEAFTHAQSLTNVQQELLAKIDSLRTLKLDLETKKSAAENKRSDLKNLKTRQKAQEASLTGARQYQKELLGKTKGEEKQFQHLLSEVEKQKAALFQELRKLEAQARGSGEYVVRVVADSIPAKGSKIFQWPEDTRRLTQSYGYTTFARRGAYGGAPHNGIDIAGGFGAPIKAIGSGKILVFGTNDGWGNWVAVQHDNNLVSVYGHMSVQTHLPVNSPVETGTIIGYEGATGYSTGSHVHLSLYREFFTYYSSKSGHMYFNYFDGTLNPLDYM